MKIFCDEIAYVQKGDLIFWLEQSVLPTPAFIAKHAEELRRSNRHSYYDFTLITEADGIEILRQTDWIDDFSLINKKEELEIIDIGLELAVRLHRLTHTINTSHIASRDQLVELKTLQHRNKTLDTYLHFRHGKVHWNLPEGFTAPDEPTKSVGYCWFRHWFEPI